MTFRAIGQRMFAQATVQKTWGDRCTAMLVSVEHQGAGCQFWAFALLTMGADIIYTTIGGPFGPISVSEHATWTPITFNYSLGMQPAIAGPRTGLAQLSIILTDRANLADPAIVTYARGDWPNAYNFVVAIPAPAIRNLKATWS